MNSSPPQYLPWPPALRVLGLTTANLRRHPLLPLAALPRSLSMKPIQVTGLRTLSWVFTLVLLSRVRIERRAGNPVARRRRTTFSLFRSVQIRRKRFDGRLGFALSGFVGLLVYDGLRSLDSAL